MSEVIPHWLTKQADLAPTKTALEEVNGRILTFEQLKDKSQDRARRLATSGVKAGDHIGILAHNSPDMVVTIHALSYLGAVCVLLNTRLTESELSYQIIDADVTHVIMADTLSDRMDTLPEHVKTFSFAEIDQLNLTTVDLVEEFHLDDVFTIVYTSGTTGFPKGVMHTYGNHWWSAIGSALNLGIDASDKWLCTLPLFHVGGLSILLKSVIYGMSVYLIEKFNESIVHDAIMNRGVTCASVVTVMLQRLVTMMGGERYPRDFRCMLLGGGPAPKSLLEKAKQSEIPVFQSYGLTETSSQIITLSPSHALEKLGSSGKPLVPAQMKIHKPDEHGVGEIVVKGPMVTTGYYNKQAETDQALQNGWLTTGDLGYCDSDGFLHVIERRKDLIISGGENIYPTELESVLSAMPEIIEIGVVGIPDNDWGQVPVAFVVTDGDVSDAAMKRFAESHLASYKHPKAYYRLNQLPRNASNKLVRTELLKYLE